MMNISPGVYTKITDLSEFLTDLPGTNGFVPILSKRGRDNQLVYISNGTDYLKIFGNPNINTFGKNYGQGPYIAKNHLTNATSLYIIRALPNDATYSNLFFALQSVSPESGSSSAAVAEPYRTELVGISFSSMNSVGELDTRLNEDVITDWVNETDTGGAGYNNGFLCYFRPIGRGDSYDDFAVRITKHVNPYADGVYNVNIYETQSDGDDIIVETFEVSFSTSATDDSGESMFIEDVINKYSANMRCKVNERALQVLDAAQELFHRNEGEDTYPHNPYITEEAAEYATIRDYIEDGGTDLGYKEYLKNERYIDFEYAKDALSNALDDLANARALPQSTISEINTRNTAITLATQNIAAARSNLNIAKQEYEEVLLLDILTTMDPDTSTNAIEPIHLKNGSDGSLFEMDERTGKPILSTVTAKQILSMAYMGLLENPETGNIDDEILNTDDVFLDIVYDPGYPIDVKTSAGFLVDETRRDCMLFMDNGDNVSCDQAELAAKDLMLNSRYIARYEGYSTVYDVFTGKDINVSPIYHMAKLVPLNDRENELWYAVAGFNRAVIDDIKALRWSPKLGERDKLYLLQLNPIVRFNVGYTVWSQLTTQKRPTALQDVNVMRLVLYIKRMLEQFLKYFIFEFNDSQTWTQIQAGVTPFLENIKSRRGLKYYNVEVGATEYEFKRKICHVNVVLKPMKVIERIELNLFIK